MLNRRITQPLIKLETAPNNVADNSNGPAKPTAKPIDSCNCGHAVPSDPSGNPKLMNPR